MLARRLALALVALSSLLPGQCIHLANGCGTVPRIACNSATPPRIGTTWLIDATNACQPSTNVMLFGTCSLNAFTFTVPVTCLSCPSCNLHVLPIITSIRWPGTFSLGIGIPANAALVGGQFCIQNACVTTCGCLSNVIQVTIQR